jgi:hypothetical protein
MRNECKRQIGRLAVFAESHVEAESGLVDYMRRAPLKFGIDDVRIIAGGGKNDSRFTYSLINHGRNVVAVLDP